MKNLLNTIGNTPVIRLEMFFPQGKIFAKIESRNPLFSVKDRAAWGMIKHAEKSGLLKKNSLLIEPTSGNTGIALAWISRIRGYRLILTMPETMSQERMKILKFLGAELVLTKGDKGMSGAIDQAIKLSKQKGAIMLNQFTNPGNSQIHFETTGPELYTQMQNKIDYAVFGVGTGGTLTGVGRYLKSKNPKIKIIAVEPEESPVLSGGKPSPHLIQGIGAGFIPAVLDTSLIDSIVKVSGQQAIKTTRELALKEGIFAGISSGAAAYASTVIASSNPDQNVVTILPDTAERYISTDLFKNHQE